MEAIPVFRILPVHLVGADVHEFIDASVFQRALQEDVGAVHVGHRELQRRTEALVHVGLGRKVEYGVDVVMFESLENHHRVADVPTDENVVSGSIRCGSAGRALSDGDVRMRFGAGGDSCRT